MTVIELPTPQLQTLSMRPVNGPEMDFAYRFAVAAQTGWPRLYLLGAVQAQTFPTMLWAGVESLFLVTSFEEIDGEMAPVPIGFVGVYDLAQRHRTAKVEIVLVPDATEGQIAEAAAMIVSYAIKMFDLRAVYCEHIDNTYSPLAFIDVAEEQGRFVDYVYHRDPEADDAPAYWDLVTKAVPAERWFAR